MVTVPGNIFSIFRVGSRQIICKNRIFIFKCFIVANHSRIVFYDFFSRSYIVVCFYAFNRTSKVCSITTITTTDHYGLFCHTSIRGVGEVVCRWIVAKITTCRCFQFAVDITVRISNRKIKRHCNMYVISGIITNFYILKLYLMMTTRRIVIIIGKITAIDFHTRTTMGVIVTIT